MRVRQQGVSIVCVYNNIKVRQDCLDRSIGGRPEIEFIPVDNRTDAYATAGAALNCGARHARYPVVLFVHQDVYLHSIDRILAAAALLNDQTNWGMLGALGMTSVGTPVGRIRDRVQLLGESARDPVIVDSLDEVLFLTRRELVLEHRLSEDPLLGWHAYAVEYGIRMRKLGLAVGAIDLAITHNSITINLARLDVAHRRVAEMHPDALPVRTTCGTLGGDRRTRMRKWPIIGRHGWRYQWLQESLLALRARRRLHVPAVIGDIRHDVDLLDAGHNHVLHVINMDDNNDFAPYETESVALDRRGRSFRFRSLASSALLEAAWREVSKGDSVLVTHLALGDLRYLQEILRGVGMPAVLGVHDGMLWLLAGPASARIPSAWRRRRAIPLGGGGRVGILTGA
jgi:hypothetical protein